MDAHDFGSEAIRVRVKAAGAELCSLRFAEGKGAAPAADPADAARAADPADAAPAGDARDAAHAGDARDAAHAGDAPDAAHAGDAPDAAHAGDTPDAAPAGDTPDAAHAGDAPAPKADDAAEMLWQAGPAWPRHAPVLFPIVGRLAHDTLRHQGFEGRLTQHGFARDRYFRFVARHAQGCTLELTDDAATRSAYPFRFRLVLDYAVTGATLAVAFRVENLGPDMLPASVGAHPAFRWPLARGVPREAHRLVFARDENGPVRRLEAGLLLPDPVATPVAGNVLPLADAVFANDAVILQTPSSREVRYEAPGHAAPAITVAWEGFSTLGIWSKPADFVCIEPWTGYASPRDFAGEFADKPGIALIPPGDTLTCTLRVTLHAAA